MRCVVDIETNSLTNPTKIWLIVCLDIDTQQKHIFRNLHEDSTHFKEFAKGVTHWIGHNCLEYDFPVLERLIHFSPGPVHSLGNITDTLILSRLVDYSRVQGHSIEAYGEQFNLPKLKILPVNFSTGNEKELLEYCVRDCEICHRIYLHYGSIINDPSWLPSIRLEHSFQSVVNQLHTNGFFFNQVRAERILDGVNKELTVLDKAILEQFPARLRLVKEVTPTLTKHGTLNRKDFRWIKDGNLSDFNGGSFCKCSWSNFNPASHKQIIEVLQDSGWSPTEKTETHKDVEQQINRLKYRHDPDKDLTLSVLKGRLEILKKSGWKINENNLATLPSNAPAPARTLARRILYESRRRTLTEWLSLVTDNRIHGKFVGIGAWTHRMAHQKPNTANIPNDKREDGSIKLLGKELRSLWSAPRKRLLVGVDAEGIQLRIFAHYVNDPELIKSLVDGKKSDRTDPHSLNQRVLGSVCRSRQAAKRFLYALLLGGGVGKFAEILGCKPEEAQAAVDTFNKRYPGFDYLKRERFPSDAKRGYFIGLDGRKVRIPGATDGDRRHLCMSGYLQNGEAIIMKMACLKWERQLADHKSLLVNFVHDEWQIETPNDMEIALRVAETAALSLKEVGEELKLNCPMAGSYWNEDNKDYTIGTNWYQTH